MKSCEIACLLAVTCCEPAAACNTYREEGCCVQVRTTLPPSLPPHTALPPGGSQLAEQGQTTQGRAVIATSGSLHGDRHSRKRQGVRSHLALTLYGPVTAGQNGAQPISTGSQVHCQERQGEREGGMARPAAPSPPHCTN